MDDISVIDRFLQVFSTYIDSGFGLLGGEIAFLSATLIAIDVTLAGLFWAMGGDDVIGRLIKKTLYVGAFAFIIGNFNALSGIVFRSFAGLGLVASGSSLTQAELLQPGRVAEVGVDVGWSIMNQIAELGGFPGTFLNLDSIFVLYFAWIVVILSFFVLAIQLFVTLLEFKLTTLAGFVLVPFALWNKTSFLAEKVLGNVMASGIKVLVLSVIVGIGSGVFDEFQVASPNTEPSLDEALALMLASLSLLGLGIFGPGIATGLVSGAPQLGAGAVAGTALGVTGTAVAVGAAATVAGGAVAAGARMAPGGIHAAVSTAGRAKSAFQSGSMASGASGLKSVAAGLGNVAKTGAQSARQKVAAGARSVKERVTSVLQPAASTAAGDTSAAEESAPQPAWAQRLHRRQQLSHAATTVAHTLRGGDGGGSGPSPSLRDPSNS